MLLPSQSSTIARRTTMTALSDRGHSSNSAATMPNTLRFDGETDDAFRQRAQRTAVIAKRLVDACLANECMQDHLADPDLPITEADIRRDPVVRIEYEQAIAIGEIGCTLAATRSKHWGDGPQILPLEPDDEFSPMRITYVYRECSLYNRRYLQRMRMKQLLGKRFRKLVGEAKYHTKRIFLQHLTEREARAIRNCLDCESGEFWRAASGKCFMDLPPPETQLELSFDDDD